MLLFADGRKQDSYRYFKLNPSRYPAKWENRSSGSPSERDFESDDYFLFYIRQPDNWIELLNMIEDRVMEFAAKLIEKGTAIQAQDNMNRSAFWYACEMI